MVTLAILFIVLPWLLLLDQLQKKFFPCLNNILEFIPSFIFYICLDKKI